MRTLSEGTSVISDGRWQSNFITVDRVGLFPKPFGSVKRFFAATGPPSPMPFRLLTSNLMKGRLTGITPLDLRFRRPRILI